MAQQPPRWAPGVALHTAFAIAAREFAHISRKGGDIPYLSHLLAVSALVMEHGGTQDQAAAALLHDVLEDSPLTPEALVAELITAGVASESALHIVQMVEGTSDGEFGGERSPATWEIRKRDYHQHLRNKASDDPSLLVSLADKVHNLESTLVQVRAGETIAVIFANFNAGPRLQHWNYHGLLDAFSLHAQTNPALTRLVTRFECAMTEVFRR